MSTPYQLEKSTFADYLDYISPIELANSNDKTLKQAKSSFNYDNIPKTIEKSPKRVNGAFKKQQLNTTVIIPDKNHNLVKNENQLKIVSVLNMEFNLLNLYQYTG